MRNNCLTPGLLVLVFLMVITSLTSVSAKKKTVLPKNTVLFTQFTYQGNDQVYKDYPLESDEFYSPVLQGCYPDPSITRKGDDYYLVCSSFSMVPGVPIFRSNDLVNWTQIGHVLDRPSQLKVQKAGISEGIYAPQISYNPGNETFYMITTHIAAGLGNIVVKTNDPMKGWSDPIKLDFDGIDPSLFFDDDGKAYVVHNDAPPAGTEEYSGHRVIKIWEYDTINDSVIPGTDKIVVDGGVNKAEKPIWIEGPHLYKKNGKYYLLCAEGGTGDWHSEVIFVGNHPKGPFRPAENNPILTQRYLNPGRSNRVEWTGHADIVDTPDGKYYSVFLGVRPNEKGRVNTGRETFMLPVDWSCEFPVFVNGLVPLKPKLKLPVGVENKTGKGNYHPTGNFSFTDNFRSTVLDQRWIGLRGFREEFIYLSEKGLYIRPFPVTIRAKEPTSTLFFRQQHLSFTATASMNYVPQSESEMAGITCLQSENFNYVFGLTRMGNDLYLVLQRTNKGVPSLVASTKVIVDQPLQLKVSASGDEYTFSYAIGEADFVNVGGVVSGDILSTDVAGGFTGAMIGLYATSVNDIRPVK